MSYQEMRVAVFKRMVSIDRYSDGDGRWIEHWGYFEGLKREHEFEEYDLAISSDNWDDLQLIRTVRVDYTDTTPYRDGWEDRWTQAKREKMIGLRAQILRHYSVIKKEYEEKVAREEALAEQMRLKNIEDVLKKNNLAVAKHMHDTAENLMKAIKASSEKVPEKPISAYEAALEKASWKKDGSWRDRF